MYCCNKNKSILFLIYSMTLFFIIGKMNLYLIRDFISSNNSHVLGSKFSSNKHTNAKSENSTFKLKSSSTAILKLVQINNRCSSNPCLVRIIFIN